MQWIGALGMAAFVLTCAAVGVKLLTLAIRGGGTPVWSCGLAFSLIAFLGYPLPVAAGLGQGTVAELNMPLLLVGMWASAGGICCFFVFTAHVFRSGVMWARILTGALIATYIGITASNSHAFLTAPATADSYAVNWTYGVAIQTMCILCFAWIAIEGLVQWRMSLRRLGLGFGDPVISNRFLMWGLFGLSTTAMVIVLMAMQLARINTATEVSGILTMAVFGVISSVFAGLAFFPPESYLARIRTAYS